MMTVLSSNRASPMSEANFLALGDGKLAYIRRMQSEEIRNMFPGAPKLQPGLPIWALLSADGTPIMLTDSREAAIANAAEAELITVAVH